MSCLIPSLSGLPVCISTNLRRNCPSAGLGHYLHLLHFHVHQGIGLHQTAIEGQILVQPRDLALHVAKAALYLFVALLVHAAPHIRGLELRAQARDFPPRARECVELEANAPAHRVDHSKARLVAAGLENGVHHERERQREARQNQARRLGAARTTSLPNRSATL